MQETLLYDFRVFKSLNTHLKKSVINNCEDFIVKKKIITQKVGIINRIKLYIAI